MCKKAVVFAGTTEGRTISEYLSRSGIKVTASAATEYGGELLEETEYLAVRTGRMDQREMQQFLEEEQPDIVVDATHPYAAEVTENIRVACRQTQTEYIRLLRETKKAEDAVYVADAKEAAEYLSHTKGNVFLTTGSKELVAFTAIPDYAKRLYVRVLSLPKVVEECDRLGFSGKHLYAMQGPFSMEMDLAMLKAVDAKWLVTKESGDVGGFEEKCRAARENGTRLLVIGKPFEESGYPPEECKKLLQKRLGLSPEKREIALVGIGMGTGDFLTAEAREILCQSEVIIGAKRMAESVSKMLRTVRTGEQEVYISYNPEDIRDYIDSHPEYTRIAIALSGDTGFYSGAKKLLSVLPEDTRVIPGISSVVFFASRLKTSWDDIYCSSLHGKQENVIGLLKKHPRIFLLLGKSSDAGTLCRKLNDYGMGDVKVSIGENLGYETERITTARAKALMDIQTDALCVCLLEREENQAPKVTGNIRDEAFFRERVPMTKEEIRCLVLSKLRLRENSVVYDIGSGTGSVSIEAAEYALRGRVYAIEKNPAAAALSERNRRHFAADNMEIIEGRAPEVLRGLPIPSHAFIGGSSGNLREILNTLFEKNPVLRVVITAVSLETIAEVTALLKEYPIEDTETLSVSVAKAKESGSHHLMMGYNPVYIFSFQGKNSREEEG